MMRMIYELGMRVMETPSIMSDGLHRDKEKLEGVVVYVNRKHRFYTAEFKLPGGVFRESFKIYKKKKVKPNGK